MNKNLLLIQGFLILALLVTGDMKLSGQVLIADINQDNEGSHPKKLISNGEDLVYLAEGDAGNGIFILEGSESEPYELLNLNEYGYGDFVFSSGLIDSLYFFVTFSNENRHLNVINILTKDVRTLLSQSSGTSSKSTGLFSKIGEDIYFMNRNSNYRSAIYRYDHNSMIVSQVFELQNEGIITEIIEFEDKLFFTMYLSGISGEYYSIWSLDLSTLNAEQISPGVESSQFLDYGALYLQKINDKLLFVNFDEDTGYEIWQSDGTVDGTKIFVDFIPGPNWGTTRIRAYGDYIYFLSEKNGNISNLFRTDGTVEGIEQVTGILEEQEINIIIDYIVEEDRIFLIIEDNQHGKELWISEGGEQEVYFLKDVNPGPLDGFSSVAIWTIQNGELLFIAESEDYGDEIWKSNGTQSGTNLIRDIYPGKESSEISELLKHNGEVFFGAEDVEFGAELWKYSPDEEDVVFVSDINTNTSSSSYPNGFTLLNDKMIFSAKTNCIGWELFCTEGSAKSTKLLNDIAAGKASNSFFHLEKFNDRCYFPAMDADRRQSYWFTDGTPEGTKFAFDPSFNFETENVSVSNLGSMNGNLYSVAAVGEIGQALFKSDGTNEGTELIKNFGPEAVFYSSFRFNNLNDEILIFEVSDFTETNLWRTDGTESGTFVLQYGNANSFEVINGNVFYLKNGPSPGVSSLWKTDGTIGGTVRVSPENLTGVVSAFIEYNGFIYYILRNSNVAQLYRTNGTINATVEIPSIPFKWLNDLKILNGKILTVGRTSDEDAELWSYDINDNEWSEIIINPGVEGSLYLLNGLVFDDLFYFQAFDDEHGNELWSTDGTDGNTQLVMDIWEGKESSNPGQFIVYQDFIYFSADANDGSGVELYKYSPYDIDNDGYLPGVDIDDNDPTVNINDPNDPDDVVIFCSLEGPNFIKDYNSLKEIVKVYPNPTVDQINIDLKSLNSHYLQIFTSDGQVIMENKDVYGKVELDISEFAKGLYRLRVFSNNGEGKGVWTIIVQ